MTPDERVMLARALRSARWAGWEVRWRGVEYGALDAHPPCLRVEYDDRERVMKVRWPDGIQRLKVRSVTEALDLLCAYVLLPPEFSSAYHDGREVLAGQMRDAAYGDQELWLEVGNQMSVMAVSGILADDPWNRRDQLSTITQAVIAAYEVAA